MDSIMSHIQIKRTLFFHSFSYLTVSLYRQGFAQESIRTMIFLQIGYCSGFRTFNMTVSPLTIITAGMSYSRPRNVDIKTKIQRIFTLAIHTAEVSFSYMNRLISSLLQNFRHGRNILRQPFPIPIRRPERSTVITFRINPVRSAMSCCVLPRQQ